MERAYGDGVNEVWAGRLARPYTFQSPFGGEEFAALVVATEAATAEERDALARDVLTAGCRYAVCAGHDCGAWEDAFDEQHVAANVDRGASTPPLVTTSHAHESVDEIVAYFARLTSSDEFTPSRFLVLVLGDDELGFARYRTAVVGEFRRLG